MPAERPLRTAGPVVRIRLTAPTANYQPPDVQRMLLTSNPKEGVVIGDGVQQTLA